MNRGTEAFVKFIRVTPNARCSHFDKFIAINKYLIFVLFSLNIAPVKTRLCGYNFHSLEYEMGSLGALTFRLSLSLSQTKS